MMRQLVIIGARGWGREVYDIAKACINSGLDIQVKGFLDDKADALDGYDNYPPILGPTETYEIQNDDIFICALGDVKYKKYYAKIILDKGGEFISLVHPTAILGNNASFGKGCVIGAYSNLSSDTRIGDFVTFSIKAGMGHDSCVGDYSHIGGLCNISGFVKIGDMVTVHPCCNILPHKTIGDGAVIGTGSVVLVNVKPNQTVFGNPARAVEF